MFRDIQSSYPQEYQTASFPILGPPHKRYICLYLFHKFCIYPFGVPWWVVAYLSVRRRANNVPRFYPPRVMKLHPDVIHMM